MTIKYGTFISPKILFFNDLKSCKINNFKYISISVLRQMDHSQPIQYIYLIEVYFLFFWQKYNSHKNYLV
jgi:hypothetical protein